MAEEKPGDPRTPDPVVPGPVEETTDGPPQSPARESLEREKAWERGESRARLRAEGIAATPNPAAVLDATSIAQRAFIALADNVRDYAIFLMDPEGIIIYWGEGARLIKWWTPDQMEGAHFRVLYPDGGAEDGTAEGHLAEAARRGEMVSEGQRIRSDGSTFWAGATLTALRDANGELQGYAKLTRDLTAAHAADAALRAAKEATETGRKVVAENRAKGAFLATMSHELRTPLQAIIAYADLLDMEIAGPLNETQRTQLARIRVSSRHLLGLATEVLDLSRLDVGGLPVRPAAHGLGPTAEEALLLVTPQADAKGLTLTSSVAGSAADLCYWGDEVRVRQILVNLLANAVKFTPSGGRVTISAGATQQAPPDAHLGGPGPWVYVRVEDNGKGIPADLLGTMFEPYEQMANATAEGAGLGLAISQRLARLMGGDLTATSTEGVGSSFFLWLENSTTPPAVAPE
ncbi:MAG: PAS domain S-box protein [Gemmatimonadetes bacterium]|nr:PAS domain S-box protein [Gemmatimonadota bacterium]